MEKFNVKYLKDYTPPTYTVASTDIAFDIFADKTEVQTTYTVSSINENIILHGDNIELISVLVNNRQLSEDEYKVTNISLEIFSIPKNCNITVNTTVYPHLNFALSGLYKTKQILITQCEPHGFRRITYSPDTPDISSIFTTTITADPKTYPVLLSNGDKIQEYTNDSGRKTVVWSDPHPKPTYLFALVAGDLSVVREHFITTSNKQVDIELYVEHGKEQECVFALEVVKKAMRWDEEKYNREYDLNTFMIVAAEDFNAGAMENKGLNIFNISCINTHDSISTDSEYHRVASVIAHEYFHNWSGNRITCRDWFQLSLKEGLTVYRESQFMEDTYPEALNRINVTNTLLEYQFTEDASATAHQVQPDSYIEVNNFYTATIYEKGAEIIRMMNVILGDDIFFKAVEHYFEKFDGTCATIEDFIDALEEYSQQDLQGFKKWYKQKGTPVLHVNSTYNKSTKELLLKFKQTKPTNDDNYNNYPLIMPVTTALFDSRGAPVNSIYKDKKTHEHVLVINNLEENIVLQEVMEQPVISTLRGLSAPVILKHELSNDELMVLMSYDNDGYNRNKAANNIHRDMIFNSLSTKQISLNSYDTLISKILASIKSSKDYSISSKLITLPKVKTIIPDLTDIVIEDIFSIYNNIMQTVFKKNKNQIIDCYYNLNKNKHHQDQAAIRQLKGALIKYMVSAGSVENADFICDEIAKTNNITEQLILLTNLCQIDTKHRVEKIQEFYHKWNGNLITYEKWLRLTAMSNTQNIYTEILAIESSEHFNSKNPNHLRALYGCFSHENLLYFHASNGLGYKKMMEKIINIDSYNPQLASRMSQCFAMWRMFNKNNQQVVIDLLHDALHVNDISKNLYEVLNKYANS